MFIFFSRPTGYHDRRGGVSQVSTMASMNMVYSIYKTDPMVVVKENRRRLALAAGFDPNAMYVTKVKYKLDIFIRI